MACHFLLASVSYHLLLLYQTTQIVQDIETFKQILGLERHSSLILKAALGVLYCIVLM